MLIDEKITNKIAFLSRLKLSEEETNEYAKDLSKIFEWMEELKKVDVEGVEPLKSVNNIILQEREDNLFKNKIDTAEVLKNAPSTENNYFTVPKVIE